MKTPQSPKSSKINAQTLLALGASVAAIATTSYYFFGPKGKAHRSRMKGWMIKVKGEVIDRIEDVKELTEPVYRDIIDSVIATYAATTKVSKAELENFAERLKSQWKDIVKSSLPSRSTSRSTKRRSPRSPGRLRTA